MCILNCNLFTFQVANDNSPSDNRAGEMRWQAERRAAMETSVSYWKAKRKPRLMSNSSQESSCSASASTAPQSPDGKDEVDAHPHRLTIEDEVDTEAGVNGTIVWAGLEPLEFIAMFPDWERRDDVAQINIQVSDWIDLLVAI